MIGTVQKTVNIATSFKSYITFLAQNGMIFTMRDLQKREV